MSGANKKPLAFVLMPFDADFDDVYSDLIVQPLTEAGFEVRRADSLLNQRNILADVVTGIADADLIVADVTGLNPNVMYELGLAHALGKRTIMLTQTLELLPFDLRPYRANEYSVKFKEAPKIAGILKGVGEAVMRGEADFSNPVQDFAPYALEGNTQVQDGPRGRSSRTSSTGDAEEDDTAPEAIGFLEGLEKLQTGSARVTAVTERLGAETVTIGGKFTEGGARLSQITKNLGADKGLQPSLAAMRDMAKDLDGFSDALAPLNEELRDSLDDVIAGANSVARFRAVSDDIDRGVVEGEVRALKSLGDSLVESYFSISGFSKTIASLPPMESHLTKSARRAAQLVSDTASILEAAQAEIERAEGLLRERLDAKGERS